ncbi:dihydrofolate reductase family protein [Sinomicrobium pectinilyticum]|uniref:dihydrofolate reductase family protein n=1 Tax=Sinomicrobium pectinilyticum TaxID=1084421 RepID=UPI001F0BE80F|nr:dihydrofolate reductase family protein [Sinomicrobium pectinilyticum]
MGRYPFQKEICFFPYTEDDNTTFISSDLAEKINGIRQQKGRDIWLYGGAGLIRTFIRLGLIDMYRILVHPTALGTGRPLFEDLEERMNLELLEVNRFGSGVVQLIYGHKK